MLPYGKCHKVAHLNNSSTVCVCVCVCVCGTQDTGRLNLVNSGQLGQPGNIPDPHTESEASRGKPQMQQLTDEGILF